MAWLRFQPSSYLLNNTSVVFVHFEHIHECSGNECQCAMFLSELGSLQLQLLLDCPPGSLLVCSPLQVQLVVVLTKFPLVQPGLRRHTQLLQLKVQLLLVFCSAN